MPELNGLDTLKAIRAHSDKNISSIKVALFTAEKEGQQIQDMRTYGIDYLLQKPINQAQFSDVLKQLSYSSEKASAPNTFSNMEYLYGITNGNPELMIELMDIFIEEVPDAIKQIKVFYQQGDFPSIQRLTHKLGSNYKYVGAHEAEQLFQSLQTDFNDEGGKQHFAHRIQHLEVITSQIIETLQVEKQKLTGRKKI
jgi:HPt (histidine-containing phosphotransfer) domain-containing protein